MSEKEKLVKLGLRSPNQSESALAGTKQILQDNIAEEWSVFQSDFESAGSTSFDEFESWLTGNGIGTTSATNIRNAMETKYASWSEFDDKIRNTYTEWGDFENDFAANTVLRSNRTTDSGLSAAGVKLYNEAGVGRGGQSIPAGGVEIYGKQIHFSQTLTVQDDPDDGGGGVAEPITYANMTGPTGAFSPDGPYTYTADVTNNTSFTGSVVVDFIKDGVVQKSQTVTLAGGEEKVVSFDYYFFNVGEFEFSIGPLDPITTSVTYSSGL
jgi:hypothetical protein